MSKLSTENWMQSFKLKMYKKHNMEKQDSDYILLRIPRCKNIDCNYTLDG